MTIAGLAQLLEKYEPPPVETGSVVALQPDGHLPPFFCVHGIGGNVLHLHRLAVHMGSTRPFLGLRHPPGAPLPDSIKQMAAQHIAAMLERQPTGPYYLGGHSYGAMVAYEMAIQLLDQGHEIGLLAIIDQRKPGWRLTIADAIPVLPKILAKLPARLHHEIFEVPTTNRVRHLRRTFVRWSKMALGRRIEATAMYDLREPKQILWYQTMIEALRSYRPAPVRVPITLFRAKEQLLSHLALDSTLGWGEIADSEVRIHVVPGDHLSLTAEPFVRELARQLSDELDAAQGVPRRLELAAE